MKKSVLSFLCLVLCVLMAQAGPVDKQQAQQQAQAFFAQKGKTLKKSSKPFKAPRKGATTEGDAYYYVFNSEGNNGFVIVSGDDRTAPVFGYSDTGSFDENNIPENMQAWLAGYVDEIKALGADESAANGKLLSAPQKAEAVKRPVAPLLTALWNQSSPYNDNCPQYNSKQCVTGCVATAMAQVMYYYRAQSASATTAEIPAYTTSEYGLSIPADPAGSPIDWANMTDTYSSSSTPAQKAAVAALMAYCGHSVQMNYGVGSPNDNGSSASSSHIPAALKNYFGYATGGASINREAYTLQEWENKVYEELLAKRPLLYSGRSSGGGHAFVVDGYDGEGLFHFNWGWGGSSNGYFLLQVANPGNNSGIGASTTSDGYARSQSAIFGVDPTSAGEPIPALPTTEIKSAQANNINVTFWNLTNETMSFSYGLGYINNNDQLKILISGSKYSVSSQHGITPTFTINASTFSNKGLPAGTYILKPMCKMDGSSVWTETMSEPVNDYVIAIYNGTNVTLQKKQPQLSVSAFSYPKGTNIGTVRVKVSIQNDGDDYLGYLYLFASKTSTKGSPVNSYGTFEGGKTTDAEFKANCADEGTYNLWVATDKNGENVIGQTQVEISAATVTNNLTAQGLSLENGNPSDYTGGTMYGTHIKGNVRLKNEGTTTFDDEITIQLYKHKTGDTYGSADKQSVKATIAVGETKAVEFDFSNQNHTKYMVFIYYASPKSQIAKYPTYYSYTLAPGVEITKTDGAASAIAATSSVTVPADAVAVNLVGVTSTVTSVTPNSNPNTLYYIGNNETAPSGLSNSNLVQGSTANEIVLTDGYDFFVPTTFTANTIKYKTTPTEGTSGTGGWTTISLPFDVSHVTANGTTIDWFHSKNDTGKNFWVRQFTGIDDADAVLFGNVEQMEAYVPYIVAFPTDCWGAQYNLVGKEIVFHGTNARLIADVPMRLVTSKINFEGTMAESNVTDSYLLNAAGNTFTRGNGSVSPFRAYFKPKDDALSSKLAIKFVDDEPTAITDLTLDEADGTVAVYTLSGMRVGTVRIVNGKPQTDALPKGVYIINGKKVIR